MEMMIQNTREHTKLKVLKEFVFKLDETFNETINGANLKMKDYQHLVYLQKKDISSPTGINISAEHLPMLELFIRLDFNVKDANPNTRLLYTYWSQLVYIEHEVYFNTDLLQKFKFTYKIGFDDAGYTLSLINQRFDYGSLPDKDTFEYMLDLFRKKIMRL
jgi:hypothetical protein